jgi:hypothetical protein
MSTPVDKKAYLPVPAAIEAVTGSRPHPTTCWRWAVQGSGGHRLQTWIVGGRRMATIESVESWIAKRTAQRTPEATATRESRVRAELAKELR